MRVGNFTPRCGSPPARRPTREGPRDSVSVEDQPHPPSRENPREGIPHPSLEIPRDAAPRSSRDILHDAFPDDESRGSSRISKTSQSSKVKLAMARLQEKKVEEEQRLLSRQQQLEHEKQRLDKEKEMFKARFEAEQAQIEVDFCSDPEHLFETFNRLPKQTSDEAVGKYLLQQID